jgi:phosphoadenosine phosphosulfate reductase
MTVLKTVTALALVSVAAAFAPATRFASRAAVARSVGFDMEASIQKTRDMRLAHLEEQAMFALKLAVENNEHPVFPNAMIAGDWCVYL